MFPLSVYHLNDLIFYIYVSVWNDFMGLFY